MKIQMFEIERFYAKHEFNAPYMLSGSDAESFTISEILSNSGEYDENLQGFLDLKLSYTESQGNPLLLEQIAQFYENLESENILSFSGAEEGIFAFMAGILTEGDHLIVQFPCYQSLFEVAKANKVEVSYWKMHENEGWKMNFKELEDQIKTNTRVIMINTPNNPTGFHLTQKEQLELIRIARNHDLIIFADEVYRLGEYDQKDRIPPFADLYSHALSLGVLSKPLGLPGLRIGWIATQSKEILDQLAIFKDYTTICNSAPSEYLAIQALSNYNNLLQRNLQIIRENLKEFKKFISKHSSLFSWTEPKAGTIGFVKCHFTEDVESFCLDLIQKKGVVLLPSTTYFFGNKHFRIGFGRKNFTEGLQKLEEYIQEHLLQ